MKIYPISIAPMMDHTDRHFRYLIRMISKRCLVYTEMIHSGAIIFGDKNRFLQYRKEEHPISLQLGGDNPIQLAECAKIGEDFGYDEINLNIGCPSDKVQAGNFGACLMGTPEKVANIVSEIKTKISIPITVKNRIGIDGKETYEDLKSFIHIVSGAGCQRFIIHARIAILKGLSPRENREIPPLRYDDVYKIKNDFPNLIIEINGGIKSTNEIENHLKKVDGVMIGRAAYENPFFLMNIDQQFFQDHHSEKLTKNEIINNLNLYFQEEIKFGTKPNLILKHYLNLFNGEPGARRYRRTLTEQMYKESINPDLFKRSIDYLQSFS